MLSPVLGGPLPGPHLPTLRLAEIKCLSELTFKELFVIDYHILHMWGIVFFLISLNFTPCHRQELWKFKALDHVLNGFFFLSYVSGIGTSQRKVR